MKRWLTVNNLPWERKMSLLINPCIVQPLKIFCLCCRPHSLFTQRKDTLHELRQCLRTRAKYSLTYLGPAPPNSPSKQSCRVCWIEKSIWEAIPKDRKFENHCFWELYPLFLSCHNKNNLQRNINTLIKRQAWHTELRWKKQNTIAATAGSLDASWL